MGVKEKLGKLIKKSSVKDVFDDAEGIKEVADRQGFSTKQKVGAGLAAGGTAAALLSGSQEEQTEEANPIPKSPEEDIENKTQKLLGNSGKGEDDAPKKEESYKSTKSLKYEEPELKEINTEIPESVSSEYKAALGQTSALADEALKMYKAERDAVKSRQLWEKIVNAVGMIASGAYGLKTGSDMSGVKFSETDWSAELSGAKDALEAAMKNVDRKQASAAQKRAMEMDDFRSINTAISQSNKNAMEKAANQYQAKKDTETIRLQDEQNKERERSNKAKEEIDQKTVTAKLTAASSKDKGTEKAYKAAQDKIQEASKLEGEARKAALSRAKDLFRGAGIDLPDNFFIKEKKYWFNGKLDANEAIDKISNYVYKGTPLSASPTTPQESVEAKRKRLEELRAKANKG